MTAHEISPEHLTTGTQSPFLPGTNIQFAWDSTSLGLIKTCPRLYQYTMIEGWQPKGENIHLRFGIEFHSAMQEYDLLRAEGIHHDAATHKVVDALVRRTYGWEVDTASKPGSYKNRHSLIGLVIDCLDHFQYDRFETFIMSNGKPAVELSFRFELEFGPNASEQPYILCGHLDRVVVANDQLMVVDYKTTTTTPGDYYFNQYEPNNQMTLYTLAGEIVLGTAIGGVVIIAAQIKLRDPNHFARGMTQRNHDQLQEWINDLQVHLLTAENYAIIDYWPMNDTACDKFGGCKFRGVCSKAPEVREIYLKADFDKIPPEERWNPLRSR